VVEDSMEAKHLEENLKLYLVSYKEQGTNMGSIEKTH